MNGLELVLFCKDDGKLDQETMDKTVQDLLAESSKEWGFKPEVKPHANPMLVRYLYKKAEGLRTGEQHNNVKTFTADKGIDQKGLADYLNKEGVDPVVKIEHPDYLKLTQVLVVVKAGKESLNRQVSIAEDLLADLNARKEESLKAKVLEFQTQTDVCRKYVQDSRVHISSMEQITSDNKDCKAHVISTHLMKDKLDAFVDNLKASIKRCKAWL